MAEIRCPQCGENNPEGRELCEHCNSPLPPSPDAIFEDQQDHTPQPTSDQPRESEVPEPAQSDQEEVDEGVSSRSTGESGWLDVLHADEEGQQPEEPPEDAFAVEEDEVEDTDWLQRIRDLDVGEEQEEDTSFPTWIADAELEKGADVSAAEGEQDIPDWLRPVIEQPQAEPGTNADSADSVEREPEPEEGGDEEPQEEQPAPAGPEEEAFPSWLAEEEREAEAQQAPREAPEDETAEEQPPPAGPEEEAFPSWLAEEEPAAEEPTQETPAAGEEREEKEPLPAEEEPDEGEIEPFELDEEEEFIDDIFDEELPSWLTDVGDEFEEPADEDISPGELPGWVEAMRPVVESSDTSGLAEDEEYIENYGPLAGIPSVLPAEPEIDEVVSEESAEHSFDLVVNKTHREYASLLESVISQEEKVTSVEKPSAIPTQRILRWLIAVLLILAVGASIITGGGGGGFQSATPDQNGETGFTALYGMVDRLEEGDTALLVFDYQPALAGELNAAASGVVDHLMQQKPYLSLVSTQPAGPSLGEFFISQTQAEHEYQHGRDYINLGYIPGQAAGVLSFSIAPRDIIPIAFNGANAWDSPPLRDVKALADFDLILILTDDPTMARIWIEQISPYTSKSKIGMIVSAQADPLVRPYYENSPQQISGLVAGLPGGRSYEQIADSPQRANAYWYPLNVGIIITILTIFIGGIANGVLNLIKQHQTKEGGGA